MKKQTVVYTCGTFDLFHIGHLNLLRNAKGLGDKLIVAVSTDELVWEYKKKKPVIPFEERVNIIRELRCVDVCIPQYSRDKFDSWQKIKFDIWVVGDDWFDNEFYQETRDKLGGIGVRTVFLPYTRGVSSTNRKSLVQANSRIAPAKGVLKK